MIWNVEGADMETGEDRFVQINAHTQEEAEQEAARQGLLVSGVYATRSKKQVEKYEPREALLDQAAVQPTEDDVGFSAFAPHVHISEQPETAHVSVAYQAHAATDRLLLANGGPRYLGLKIASRMALAAAAVLYALTGLLIYRLGKSCVESFTFPASINGLAGLISDVADDLAFFVIAATGAVLLHCLSAGCMALRDIARNSFHAS